MRKPSEPLAMRKSKAHWEESPVNSACNAALLGNKSTTSKAGKSLNLLNFETTASIMSPLQTQQSTGSDEIRYVKAKDTSGGKCI